jgi:hypothetical protein
MWSDVHTFEAHHFGIPELCVSHTYRRALAPNPDRPRTARQSA